MRKYLWTALTVAISFGAAWVLFEYTESYIFVEPAEKAPETCSVPQDFCNPSIESLENELAVSFNKLDECNHYLELDKKTVIQELNYCQSVVLRERDVWKLRATQMVSVVESYKSDLDASTEKLYGCVNDIAECVERLDQCDSSRGR